LSGATAITSPNSFATLIKALIPGAVIPSSLTTKINRCFSRLPDRVFRHEVCPLLSGQLHQPGALGPAGVCALPGGLGLPDPGGVVGGLVGPADRCPPGAADHWIGGHRDDRAQGLSAGLPGDPAALDHPPGADRPTARFGLEIPAADRPGQPADHRCPQAGLPWGLRWLIPLSNQPRPAPDRPSWADRFRPLPPPELAPCSGSSRKSAITPAMRWAQPIT